MGEWQAAARGLSAANTAHQVAPTTHAARHVEAAAAAYLAPEFTQDVDGTTPIDIFGLGATAYLILTGQAPAAGRSELAERLAREGGLSPSAVDESIPPDVDAMIALATAPRITERIPDVDEFLAALDDAIGKTTPDPAEEDPWDAQEGIELPDGYDRAPRPGHRRHGARLPRGARRAGVRAQGRPQRGRRGPAR